MHDTASEEPSPAFDFDEWARLWRRDPAAFEARRQALLGLELARGDAGQRERARAALAAYERLAAGGDAAARLQVASLCLAESVAELGRCLGELDAALPREPGASGEG